MAVRVDEFDSDVDRAALDRQETNVDVAILKLLNLLVLRVHKEDIFVEVTGLT